MSAQQAHEILRPSPLPEMSQFTVHNSGPFFVYAPGEAIHRVDARDSVAHAWAGLLVPVTDYPQVLDKEMSGVYVAGTTPDGKKTINRIWASHIVDLIHRPYYPRAIQVTALDSKPLVTCHDNFSVTDNMLAEFNRLICPHPVGFPEPNATESWDVPPEARRLKVPADVLDFIAQENIGILGYRDKCLTDAESLCGDTEIGFSLREAIGQMRGAIAAYRAYATSLVDESEKEIEKQGKLQAGKAVYDHYDRKLMWLLGRKPRELQAPQIVVPQMPAQSITMGAEFGEALGNAIAAAVAPLQAEIQAMKARRGGRPRRQSQTKTPTEAVTSGE